MNTPKFNEYEAQALREIAGEVHRKTPTKLRDLLDGLVFCEFDVKHIVECLRTGDDCELGQIFRIALTNELAEIGKLEQERLESITPERDQSDHEFDWDQYDSFKESRYM